MWNIWPCDLSFKHSEHISEIRTCMRTVCGCNFCINTIACIFWILNRPYWMGLINTIVKFQHFTLFYVLWEFYVKNLLVCYAMPYSSFAPTCCVQVSLAESTYKAQTNVKCLLLWFGLTSYSSQWNELILDCEMRSVLLLNLAYKYLFTWLLTFIFKWRKVVH